MKSVSQQILSRSFFRIPPAKLWSNMGQFCQKLIFVVYMPSLIKMNETRPIIFIWLKALNQLQMFWNFISRSEMMSAIFFTKSSQKIRSKWSHILAFTLVLRFEKMVQHCWPPDYKLIDYTKIIDSISVGPRSKINTVIDYGPWSDHGQFKTHVRPYQSERDGNLPWSNWIYVEEILTAVGPWPVVNCDINFDRGRPWANTRFNDYVMDQILRHVNCREKIFEKYHIF